MEKNNNDFISHIIRPNNKRFLLIGSLFFSLCLFSLLSLSNNNNNTCNTIINIDEDAITADAPINHAVFGDLNQLEATAEASTNREKVLILTPLKNAANYLDRYFELLEALQYPKDLINIAFLVSDTTDNTIDILKAKSEHIQFDSFHIYEKDFKFELSEDQRHEFSMQPLRRQYMALARNYLLTAALHADHSWVLWLDVDVTRYPETILKDLQSVNVDVVVPNCLRETEDGSFWGYDKNNWQETPESWEMQKNLDPDYVLLEGYSELETYRYAMVDMPTHEGALTKVPLDGVGATFTLVKAHVHREGANFPAYPFQHQVETEGFAKMAKAMGFGVYGLPSYRIHHINNS